MKKELTLLLQEYLRSGLILIPEGTKIMSNWQTNISASVVFSVGDEIRITNSFDHNYGMIGKIIRHEPDDDSYLIEFEYSDSFGTTKNVDWYYGTSEFVPRYTASLPSPSLPFGDLLKASKCRHEWREDSFFTTRVYKTCKLCGKRHEEI